MAKRQNRSGGRTTPKGTRPDTPRTTDPSLSDLLLRDAEKAASEINDVNEAEGWASAVQTNFRRTGIPPNLSASPKTVLRAARDQGGTSGAVLAAAMAVYGPASLRKQAAQARNKLIASGAQVPEWTLELGQVTTGRVVMLSDVWGDGCSIHLDCMRDGETIGIGTTIDAIGGIVAHGFTYGPITAKFEEFALSNPDSFITDIDPADARATVEAALAATNETFEVPEQGSNSSDPDPDLRALVEQRFSLLPDGGTSLVARSQLSDGRSDLIARFLALPGATDLPDVDDLVDTFCDFAGYCDGDPLRWSPARVDTFLRVWVPAKVIADEAWYRNLPIVFREWLRFAASERDLPSHALDINLSVVDGAINGMQENRLDPTKASAGAALMRDMLADGVDLENQTATQSWIDRRNNQHPPDEPH